jgi:drug/metabolite transporter (DMT)-like permease
MCAGILCLTVNDAFAKWLTDHYDPLQVVFLRNLVALPMVTAGAVLIGGPHVLRTSHLGLHAMRGLLLVSGSFCFFMGLKFLPLAEAVSLVFAAPIFITALSVPLLGEKVGWRRWSAVLVGFLGVLIIVRPGAAAFQYASLFVVATALFYALIMLSARRINRTEGIWTLMFYVVLFPLVFSTLAVPAVWQPVQTAHIPHLVALAVFGTLGLTLISQAFRMAPAPVVAPFDYTALIWASLLGWMVWGELPDSWTYGGAAVIIASGIYIIFRETRSET